MQQEHLKEDRMYDILERYQFHMNIQWIHEVGTRKTVLPIAVRKQMPY